MQDASGKLTRAAEQCESSTQSLMQVTQGLESQLATADGNSQQLAKASRVLSQSVGEMRQGVIETLGSLNEKLDALAKSINEQKDAFSLTPTKLSEVTNKLSAVLEEATRFMIKTTKAKPSPEPGPENPTTDKNNWFRRFWPF